MIQGPNEIADLRSELEAAEGRIERARERLKLGENAQGHVPHAHNAIVAALKELSEPANAEGIASEGGSAKADNPHKVLTDAPSAEADCDSLRMEVQAARAKALRDNEYLLARAEVAERRILQARWHARAMDSTFGVTWVNALKELRLVLDQTAQPANAEENSELHDWTGPSAWGA
jgi:hypothetical protein